MCHEGRSTVQQKVLLSWAAAKDGATQPTALLCWPWWHKAQGPEVDSKQNKTTKSQNCTMSHVTTPTCTTCLNSLPSTSPHSPHLTMMSCFFCSRMIRSSASSMACKMFSRSVRSFSMHSILFSLRRRVRGRLGFSRGLRSVNICGVHVNMPGCEARKLQLLQATICNECTSQTEGEVRAGDNLPRHDFRMRDMEYCIDSCWRITRMLLKPSRAWIESNKQLPHSKTVRSLRVTGSMLGALWQRHI